MADKQREGYSIKRERMKIPVVDILPQVVHSCLRLTLYELVEEDIWKQTNVTTLFSPFCFFFFLCFVSLLCFFFSFVLTC